MTCWWNDLGKVASSKTEAGERSDRLELLSRPGGQDHHQQEDFQGGENSLLLAVGISKYIFTGVLFRDCGRLVKFFSSSGDRGNIKRGWTAASWWPKVAWGDTRGFLKKNRKTQQECHVIIVSSDATWWFCHLKKSFYHPLSWKCNMTIMSPESVHH